MEYDAPMTDELTSAEQEAAGRPASSQLDLLKQLMQAPQRPEDLDIPLGVVIDLLLRVVFNEGVASVRRLTEITRLDLKLIDSIMEKLQAEQLVEVASAGSMGRFTYSYSLTDAGAQRARDAMERTQYV